MLLFRYQQKHSIQYFYLIWNLFLAAVPYFISLMILNLHRKQRRAGSLTILLWLIWFLFYPNAPYMLTDFIHFGRIDFVIMNEEYIFEFNRDLSIWYDFILNSLLILTGVVAGIVSLNVMQKIVYDKKGCIISWLFIIFMCLASGYGIYLGRFGRFNSWDIFSDPISLFRSIINSIHRDSIIFTAMFGFFLFLLYILIVNGSSSLIDKNDKD